MSPRGYHAILGLFNIARGKTYSGAGKSVTEKSVFTTTAKKKKKSPFLFNYTALNAPPQNSPENWEHPKHFSVLAEESHVQISLSPSISELSLPTLPKSPKIYVKLHFTL